MARSFPDPTSPDSEAVMNAPVVASHPVTDLATLRDIPGGEASQILAGLAAIEAEASDRSLAAVLPFSSRGQGLAEGGTYHAR